MKKLFGWLFLAAIVFGIWFFGSQFYAAHDLRQAARDGDVARLEGRVDFPAFRDSLKSQIENRIETEAAERGGPLGSLGSKLAKAGTGVVVDTVVTPETVAQMIRTGQAAGLVISRRESEREPVAWRFERGGFDTFRLAAEEGSGALVFRRDGLGWKLVGVDLDNA